MGTERSSSLKAAAMVWRDVMWFLPGFWWRKRKCFICKNPESLVFLHRDIYTEYTRAASTSLLVCHYQYYSINTVMFILS